MLVENEEHDNPLNYFAVYKGNQFVSIAFVLVNFYLYCWEFFFFLRYIWSQFKVLLSLIATPVASFNTKDI